MFCHMRGHDISCSYTVFFISWYKWNTNGHTERNAMIIYCMYKPYNNIGSNINHAMSFSYSILIYYHYTVNIALQLSLHVPKQTRQCQIAHSIIRNCTLTSWRMKIILTSIYKVMSTHVVTTGNACVRTQHWATRAKDLIFKQLATLWAACCFLNILQQLINTMHTYIYDYILYAAVIFHSHKIAQRLVVRIYSGLLWMLRDP